MNPNVMQKNSASRMKDFVQSIVIIGISFILGYSLRTFHSSDSSCSSQTQTDGSKAVDHLLRFHSNIINDGSSSSSSSNSGNCCKEKEQLQDLLAKSVTAENFDGIDGSDPNVSRLQLAQALKWMKKEKKLLMKQTAEQMSEIGRLEQICGEQCYLGGTSDDSSESVSVSSSIKGDDEVSSKVNNKVSDTTATPSSFRKPVYTCKPGAGQSYKDFDHLSTSTSTECEEFCDETVGCQGFDVLKTGSKCRIFKDITGMRPSVGTRIFCTKIKPTTIESSKDTLQDREITDAQSSTSTTSTTTTSTRSTCIHDWIDIVPSKDARYEGEDGPAQRLDGMLQLNKDIKEKFTVQMCEEKNKMGGIIKVCKNENTCHENKKISTNNQVSSIFYILYFYKYFFLNNGNTFFGE